MKPYAIVVILALSASGALADVPRVVADIPPVHSLVARVMQGVGEPEMIVPPGASPHDHAMRPSEAQALARADAVVWVGEALTPWLGRAVQTLADNALSLELLEADGTTRLDFREGVVFGDGDSHGGDAAPAAAAGEPRDAGHGHAHGEGGVDPHAWLDPVNAMHWLDLIAAALARVDPENAETYAANAADGRAEIEALMAEVAATLAPVRDRPFVVFHDAYHYIEHRFGTEAAGAISLGDATAPGPARMTAVRQAIAELDAPCVFVEPQSPTSLLAAVIEGSDARVAKLDPLGAGLSLGPALYPQLVRRLAGSLVTCLGGTGP